MFARIQLPASFIIAASLVACSGFEEPAAGPQVLSFAASPQIVEPGGRSTLSWEIDQTVQEITLEDSAGNVLERYTEPNGTFETANLNNDSVFILRIQGSTGATGASVVVQINFPRPSIQSFSATETSIEVGQAITLAWTTTAATDIGLLANGAELASNLPAVGSTRIVPAQTTSYVLHARGSGGEAQAELTVTVRGALPNIRFEVNPPRIRAGGTSTLSWSVSNATRVRVQQSNTTLSDSEVLSGSTVVSPTTTTDYVLIADNEFGSKSSTVSVSIRPAVTPTIDSFVAMPNPVARGSSVTVNFATTEADTVRLFFAGRAVATQGNTATVIVDATADLRLLAENDIGQNESSLTLFAHDPPRINVWSVPSQVIAAPQDIVVSYDVSSVAQLVVLSDGLPVDTLVDSSSTTRNVTGMEPVFVADTTELELVARSAAGEVRSSLVIVRGIAEVEPNDVTPQTLTASAALVGANLGVGDIDRFRITVPNDGSVFAETWTSPGHCNLDTKLSLLSPTGTVLEIDDNDGIGVCSQIDGSRDPMAVGLPAGSYQLVVEAATATASGFYALAYAASAPVCGDGRREGSEVCDDGNLIPGDGCDGLCTFEFAATITAPGATVPGNLQSGFAAVAVDINIAGSSIEAVSADPGLVTCAVDTRVVLMTAAGIELGRRLDGGTGNCAALDPEFDSFAADLAVGRYVVLTDVEAGSGGPIEVAIQVRGPSCGNRITEQRAGEQCDDGNQANGDGCSATCALESPEVPESEPNDNQATADPSGLVGAGRVTLSGGTAPSGDDDVYRLRVPAGQTLRLSARTYTTRGQPMSCDRQQTDTRLFVESAGTEVTDPAQPGALAFNDDIDNPGNIWCSAVQNVVLAGGAAGADFFVRVQGWQDTAATSYFLDVQLSP